MRGGSGRQGLIGEIWLMVVEKRMQFPVIEYRYDAKWYLSVYVLQASSMQLHTFMPGVDVARYALLVISIPPFRIAARETCAKVTNLYSVWGDDTIWKMLCQPCPAFLPSCLLAHLLDKMGHSSYYGEHIHLFFYLLLEVRKARYG